MHITTAASATQTLNAEAVDGATGAVTMTLHYCVSVNSNVPAMISVIPPDVPTAIMDTFTPVSIVQNPLKPLMGLNVPVL